MKSQLGEILVSDSIISEEEFNRIRVKHEIANKDIGIALVNLGYLTHKQLEKAIIKKNNQIIKDTEIILLHYINFINFINSRETSNIKFIKNR